MKIKFRTEKNDSFNTDVVYVRDIGDRYHKSDYDPSDELLNAALKIRRIYKKYSDYQEAVAVFNEYFARIVEKYGGPKLFKMAYISGQITDFLPPIPKMKNKRLGKLVNKNMMINSVNFKKTNFDLLDDVIDTMGEDAPPLLLARTDEKIKGLKKLEKVIARHGSRNNPLRKSKDISVLEAYFARRREEEEKDMTEVIENITLTQMLSDQFYDILNSLNTKDSDELVSYNGELIPRKQLDTIDLIKKMNEEGWNTVKVLKDMDANNTILNITKKQRKEEKKARKRKKKAESYMAKLMSDNKFDSFDAFDDAMSSAIDESIFARFRD